jgi:hypothetical protein
VKKISLASKLILVPSLRNGVLSEFDGFWKVVEMKPDMDKWRSICNQAAYLV